MKSASCISCKIPRSVSLSSYDVPLAGSYYPESGLNLTPMMRFGSGTYNVRESEIIRDAPRFMRTLVCSVQFLDGAEEQFELDRHARGQDLLDKVFEHLELIEKDYFGLQFVDLVGEGESLCWLDATKSIRKQMQCAPFVLYFRVKFYVTDPSKLQEEYTRYHFFLQLRKDILDGRLVCVESSAALLGSYAVQSELGDYSIEEHGEHYLDAFQFVPNQTASLVRKLMELHKLHRGQTPSDAEFNFLDHAKRLDMYGVDLYKAYDTNGAEIHVGVNAQGVVVFQNFVKMNTFSWAKILKLSFKRKQFFVQLKSDEDTETVLGFNTVSCRACKMLWKSCIEHHTFFRLIAPPLLPPKSIFSLGSRYRYSGRTEYQTQEDAKRRAKIERTFHRTGSKLSFTRSIAGASLTRDGLGHLGSAERRLPSSLSSYGGAQVINGMHPSRYAPDTGSTTSTLQRGEPPTLVNGSATVHTQQPGTSAGSGAAMARTETTFGPTVISSTKLSDDDGLMENSYEIPQHLPNNATNRSNGHYEPRTSSTRHASGASSVASSSQQRTLTNGHVPTGNGVPPILLQNGVSPTKRASFHHAPSTHQPVSTGGCNRMSSCSPVSTPTSSQRNSIVNGHANTPPPPYVNGSSTGKVLPIAASFQRSALATSSFTEGFTPAATQKRFLTNGNGGVNGSATTNGTSPLSSNSSTPPLPNGHVVNGGSSSAVSLVDTVLVRLKPDDQGRFGFNVKGGADQNHPIIVSRVLPGSPADICSPRLNEGDQLVLINGRDVSLHTHDQVVRFIRSAREPHSGELVLTVRPNVYYGQEIEPDFQYVPETPHVAESVPKSDLLSQSLLLLKDSLASGAALAQFEQLYRKKPGLTMNVCRLSENLHKNRYRDIAPYDGTRVELVNAPTGDYINANFVNMKIPTSGIVNRYIAAQGPLPHTFADFWHLVCEQLCNTIIMLTATVERGRVKCDQYWPNVGTTQEFAGGLEVTCTKETDTRTCTLREFTLVNKQSKEERQVTQMQYVAWPDHGVPEDSMQFVEFVKEVRQCRIGTVEPLLVHCSAGIGRTGVLILMETAMCSIEANEPVYPLDIVRTMRDQRPMLIQTASQYKFVCEAILKVFTEGIVKPLPEYHMLR